MARPSSVLTGYRSIEEFLKSPKPDSELIVSGQSQRVLVFEELARRNGVPIRKVLRKELARIGGPDARDCLVRYPDTAGAGSGTTASGVRELDELIPDSAAETSLILLLDHVTDPHNYGAILRSADQFQVDCVVTTDRRSAGVTPVVLQSSAGTADSVPKAVVKNLVTAIDALKESGFWVYGADMTGETASTTDLRGRTAIVMGSEGSGLHRLVKERCDALIRIPAKGRADSFNVSVATGILLYEVRRQQDWPGS